VLAIPFMEQFFEFGLSNSFYLTKCKSLFSYFRKKNQKIKKKKKAKEAEDNEDDAGFTEFLTEVNSTFFLFLFKKLMTTFILIFFKKKN